MQRKCVRKRGDLSGWVAYVITPLEGSSILRGMSIRSCQQSPSLCYIMQKETLRWVDSRSLVCHLPERFCVLWILTSNKLDLGWPEKYITHKNVLNYSLLSIMFAMPSSSWTKHIRCDTTYLSLLEDTHGAMTRKFLWFFQYHQPNAGEVPRELPFQNVCTSLHITIRLYGRTQFWRYVFVVC
jgi:hypothetical protein